MKKSNFQKQIIVLIAIAVMLVAFILVYFLLIKPLSQEDPDANNNANAETVYDRHGQRIVNDRPFILEPLDYDKISRIEVKNEYGTYAAIQENGEFYFEGVKGYELDYEKTAALRVDTAYLFALTEVEDVDFAMISDYGLDLEDPFAEFTVTDQNDSSYRIIIGDKIPTLGGYYAMLEGRQAVYILGTDIENSVLSPLEAYFNPQLIPPVPSALFYTCKHFYLKHQGELFIELQMVDKQNEITFGNQGTHKMIYPTTYTPSSNNISIVFESFTSFAGDKVVKIAPDESDLIEYGFLDEEGNNISDYELYCKYDTVEATVYFSRKDETTYYALSSIANIIVEMSDEKLPFFEWELINWVNRAIFSMNINDVASISVDSKEISADFEIIGEDNNIRAVYNNTDLLISNFKQYYMSLLYITIVGYESKPENAEPILEMAITTDYGEVMEYVFYDVSDRKTYFTINGVGEFYVSRDYILKLIEDTKKVVVNETVVGNPNLG